MITEGSGLEIRYKEPPFYDIYHSNSGLPIGGLVCYSEEAALFKLDLLLCKGIDWTKNLYELENEMDLVYVYMGAIWVRAGNE